MKKTLLYFFTLVLALRLGIFASGFQLNEHGARAMGMADAFAGVANDPSTIYFNPAGLTNLRGTNFLAGVALIAPSADFEGPLPSTTKTEQDSQVFTPINFYATHSFKNGLSLGLGVNNQYGLGTKWPNDWVGRYLAVETEITAFYFTPVVAYKISDVFSIGVGAVIALADVTIINNIPLQNPVSGQLLPDGRVELEGDATSFGFSAGIFVKPSDVISFGVSYRSENEFDFEGDAATTPATLDFTHPIAGPQSIPLPHGAVKAPLTTPQNLTVGVGLYPSKDLTISADFQWVGWSSYDKLEITFEEYDLDPITPEQENVETAIRNYEDSFIIRMGAEYLISPEFALRGGLFYDNNPVKDNYVEPTLPDADRYGINVGCGYNFSPALRVDLAYLLLLFSEREVTDSEFSLPDGTKFNGTYQNTTHLFGVNFSYAIN